MHDQGGYGQTIYLPESILTFLEAVNRKPLKMYCAYATTIICTLNMRKSFTKVKVTTLYVNIGT